MEKETWRDIPGYEGLYQVSDKGRVRSLDRYIEYSNGKLVFYKGKIIKQNEDKHGRMLLRLSKNKNRKSYFVHSLVALAFIGERPKDYVVAHCDGNNKNNDLSNLRYDTVRENSIDMYRHGYKVTIGKLSIEDVVRIRELYKTGDYTQVDIAKMYNVRRPTIGKIVRRETFNWLNDDGSIKESTTATTHKNNT